MLAAIKQRWYRRERMKSPLKNYLQTKLPDRGADYRQLEFLAADLELTNLDITKGEIISIAYVPVIESRVVMEQAARWYVKPKGSVGHSATIHGIHDRELESAVPLDFALDGFLKALKGRVLLLHHASLDLLFLNRALKRLYGAGLVARVVDTLCLEKNRLLARGNQLVPDTLRLYQCRSRYNLPCYKAHDALCDALATAELFLAQADHISGDQKLTLKTLMKKGS